MLHSHSHTTNLPAYGADKRGKYVEAETARQAVQGNNLVKIVPALPALKIRVSHRKPDRLAQQLFAEEDSGSNGSRLFKRDCPSKERDC